MRFSGRLKSWNTDRGFGFIEPDGGGQEVFVHISAVPTRLRPPKLGQALTFEVELNREGKKRAANIGVAEQPRAASRAQREAPAQWSLASALAIPAFVAVYAVVATKYGVSPWFAVAYIVLSVVCLMLYAFDKSAAAAGRWRSSEQSLLALGLLGGWPGGLVAQQCYGTSRPRCRSAKPSGAWSCSTWARSSSITSSSNLRRIREREF